VSRSVLLHVQYLLGIGHLQRSLRIAGALARDGITVTLVNGGPPAAELAADPKVRVVQLEPVRARDASFALVDDAGQPIGDTLRARRQEALLAAFAAARPDAVVIEGFPFALQRNWRDVGVRPPRDLWRGRSPHGEGNDASADHQHQQ